MGRYEYIEQSDEPMILTRSYYTKELVRCLKYDIDTYLTLKMEDALTDENGEVLYHTAHLLDMIISHKDPTSRWYL